MFDVGINEIFIIALVALVVLGPERLPKAARLAGLWMRKARAHWFSVKAELERELAAEDLKRSLSEPMQSLRPDLEEVQRSLQEDVGEIRREFDDVAGQVRAPVVDPAADAAAPVPPPTRDAP